MAKQKGRELLIKQGLLGAGVTICGLTAKTITINNGEVDVTTPDCATPGGPLWAESMEGVKRLAVSGSGVYEDSVSEAAMNTLALSATPIDDFEVIVPGLGTYSGKFILATMEFAGEMEGAVKYSMSLNSSGEVTFTAEV